jgi:hypothetical protein
MWLDCEGAVALGFGPSIAIGFGDPAAVLGVESRLRCAVTDHSRLAAPLDAKHALRGKLDAIG